MKEQYARSVSILVVANGKEEWREVDYYERATGTKMNVPVPVMKDGEIMRRTIDGRILLINVPNRYST